MNLFKKPSVSAVLADIEAKIDHLTILAEVKAEEIKAHDEIVAIRTKLKEAAQVEIERATRVVSKIKELIA